MELEPITSLAWAYQLHYYLVFRTHLRRPRFATPEAAQKLSVLLEEICARHEYHLLKHRTYRDHVRCVLSLRPNQDLSTVVRTTKANSAGVFCKSRSVRAPLWARGYFARSLGRVHIGAVRRYLDEQADHHGYARRVIPPVYRYG